MTLHIATVRVNITTPDGELLESFLVQQPWGSPELDAPAALASHLRDVIESNYRTGEDIE